MLKIAQEKIQFCSRCVYVCVTVYMYMYHILISQKRW